MTQQKFIGRKKELTYLNKKYSSSKAENIILYGRRRIGKTELILEFCKEKPSLYFLATNDSEQKNIDALQEVMANFLEDSSFLDVKVDNFNSLFSLFFKFNSEKRKVIICIDEFPYLVSLNKGMLSIFQKLWDSELRNQNVMLILNGSSISMMEEYALSSKSPFYGRRTGQWQVNNMDFSDLQIFFPNYSIEDVFIVWSIIGGIPGYLRQFEKNLSVFENIEKHILSKGSYLYEEADILLRDEFREPKNYKLLLQALSLGHTTMGEICNYTGLDKSMISKYLDTLQNTRIVTARLPITASSNAKKHLYYLTDAFFLFWFKFVNRYKIDLEANRSADVLNLIKNNLSSYLGHSFEEFCKLLLMEKYILKNHSFSKIGKWWHKDKEIDIIALNEDKNEIIFAECKWKEKVDAENILNELKQKSKFVDWQNDKRKEIFVVFAKSFFRKIKEFQGKKVYCFDLKDINSNFTVNRIVAPVSRKKGKN